LVLKVLVQVHLQPPVSLLLLQQQQQQLMPALMFQQAPLVKLLGQQQQ
jgi:hypothetical protein